MRHRELFIVELHFTITNMSAQVKLARGNLLAMEQFQIDTIQDTASQCSERGPRSALKPRAQTTVTRTKYFIRY